MPDLIANTIFVRQVDDVYLNVFADAGIEKELYGFFTFQVPGFQYMPAFKKRHWNGKIHLYNRNKLYVGLLNDLAVFAQERGYKVITDLTNTPHNYTLEQATKYFKLLNPHNKRKSIEARDFQISAFLHAVNTNRCILLSPTSSGKSLMIYALLRWWMTKGKVLIIVPTTSLVEQMFTDFEDYSYANGFDVDKHVHRIYSGKEKETKKNVVISTWQSIYAKPKVWFKQFQAVIGDECHLFAAKSLTQIMTNLEVCPYRVGTSGTLQDAKTHKLVLTGLFGPILKVISTKELMDRGDISDLKIHCYQLEYDQEARKKMHRATYQDEITFIVEHPKRNRFIRDLALSRKTNTLVLFNYVEKHGKILHQMIAEKADKNRKVFYVHGDVSAMEREQVRAIVEQEQDAIIVASYGTFSTGINIKNLHNVIFASPVKSAIRNKQSIGRGLRKAFGKTHMNLYDLCDVLETDAWTNHTLKHFLFRVEIYNDEKFTYKTTRITL